MHDRCHVSNSIYSIFRGFRDPPCFWWVSCRLVLSLAPYGYHRFQSRTDKAQRTSQGFMLFDLKLSMKCFVNCCLSFRRFFIVYLDFVGLSSSYELHVWFSNWYLSSLIFVIYLLFSFHLLFFFSKYNDFTGADPEIWKEGRSKRSASGVRRNIFVTFFGQNSIK